MFYEPGKTDHNLPHDPFKACVIPRPIGWISTVSPTLPGQAPSYNLAPFSQFNNLTFDPPYVMFSANQTGPIPQSSPTSSTTTNNTNTNADPSTAALNPSIPQSYGNPGFNRKDTVHNTESTGYFCWQLATHPLRHAVNSSAQSLPYTVDEFEVAGLEKTWSTCLPIKIPMVKASPVRFECQYHSTIRLPGNPPFGTVDIIIGRVLGIHIDDSCLTNGKIDVSKTLPIARCGYYDYAVVRETFEMIIPGDKAALGGLEGSTKWNREMGERQKQGHPQLELIEDQTRAINEKQEEEGKSAT